MELYCKAFTHGKAYLELSLKNSKPLRILLHCYSTEEILVHSFHIRNSLPPPLLLVIGPNHSDSIPNHFYSDPICSDLSFHFRGFSLQSFLKAMSKSTFAAERKASSLITFIQAVKQYMEAWQEGRDEDAGLNYPLHTKIL